MTTLEKPAHIKDLVSSMNCDPESSDYKTEMEGWGCVVWAGCEGDKEVVHCSGYYGHFYPWWGAVEGFNYIWQFMKNPLMTSKNNYNLLIFCQYPHNFILLRIIITFLLS